MAVSLRTRALGPQESPNLHATAGVGINPRPKTVTGGA